MSKEMSLNSCRALLSRTQSAFVILVSELSVDPYYDEFVIKVTKVQSSLYVNACCRLVCAVSYKTPTDEKMYFRKFFKFPVTKPIDVRTKFYNAEVSVPNLHFFLAEVDFTLCILQCVSCIWTA